MKMILCNVNPHKKFNRECEILVKVQIDNSLELGWRKEDIILATNFDYEYRGIKSTPVEDANYYDAGKGKYGLRASTHIFILENLFRLGLIEKNQVYFYHDFDAYQLEKIDEEELEMGKADIALGDYGWSPLLNVGVMFFKESARDILNLLKETVIKNQLKDEKAFALLVETGKIGKERYQRLNIRYNFGMRNIGQNFQIADKPLKILHFHPLYFDRKLGNTTMNLFFHGMNEINKPLMNERLKRIFRSHGLDESYGTKCTYKDFMRSISYQ